MPAASGCITSRPGSSDRNLRASSFLSLRFPCNRLSFRIPTLLLELGMGFGPVTNGLGISPTGSKDTRFAVPATMPVIASTGAMLTLGHMAPMKVSAIACRIGSRIRVAKVESSRQVSGRQRRHRKRRQSLPPNRKRLRLSSEAYSKLVSEAFPMLANGYPPVTAPLITPRGGFAFAFDCDSQITSGTVRG